MQQLAGDNRIDLVRDDLNEEVWLIFILARPCDGLIVDLLKRITGIRTHLSKADLLVGSEGFDDQAHPPPLC